MSDVSLNSFKMDMSRRGFVAAAAGVAGLALAGCQPADQTGKVAETAAEATVKTVGVASGYNCSYCYLQGKIKDGKIIGVEPGPLPNRPGNSNACARCMAFVEKVQDENARILHPMRRTGERGSGQFEQISWDEAIEEISAKLKAVMEKNPQAASFWGMTGNLTTLANQSVNRFAFNIGASTWEPEHIMGDHGESIGMFMTCGDPAPGHDGEDWYNSKFLLFFGANKVDTYTPVARHIAEARRRGTKLVVVDPRLSSTAAMADQWVPINPGTDPALILAMMNLIFQNDLHDKAYLANYTCAPLLVNDETGEYLHPSEGTYCAWDTASNSVVEIDPADAGGEDDQTSGPESTLALTGSFSVDGVNCHPAMDDLMAEAAKWPIDRTAEVTGVPAEVIQQLAIEYAEAAPAGIQVTQGTNRTRYTYATSRAAVTLGAVCGNIGKSGGGVGREHLGVPIATTGDAVNFISAGSMFNDGEWYDVGEKSDAFGAFYEVLLGPYSLMADELIAGNAFKSSEFYDAALTANPVPVDFLYIAISNFINQSPDANKIINEVFPAIDFIVTADPFRTWTTEYSDIVLPVATYWECWDVTNDGPFVRMNQPQIERMGESKSDCEIFSLLAKEIGVGDYWNKTDEEWVRTFLEGSEHPGMESFDMEEMLKTGIFARDDGVYGPSYPFGDKKFSTPTGRIEFYRDDLVSFGEQVPTCQRVDDNPEDAFKDTYPLQFIQWHSRAAVHTQGMLPTAIKAIEAEPYLVMNAVDADARGIAHDDVVRAFNDRGSMKLRAFVSDGIIPGTTGMSQGWTPEQFIEGHYQMLTHYTKNAVEEFISATSSPFNDVRIQVEKA